MTHVYLRVCCVLLWLPCAALHCREKKKKSKEGGEGGEGAADEAAEGSGEPEEQEEEDSDDGVSAWVLFVGLCACQQMWVDLSAIAEMFCF